MAQPIYSRSPLSIMKRIRMSPRCSRPHVYCQRAGLASAADPPSQPSQPSQSTELAMREEFNTAAALLRTQARNEEELPPGFEHISKLDPKTKEILYGMSLPQNVQAVYLQPLRRAPTYGIKVCDLQLRSFSVRNLEFFADFAMRAAYYLGLVAKGPIPMPQITQRWTVPRSPFIFKKSQENFERKTLRRMIQIQDGNPETVQCWLGYLEKRSYYGIGMKANVWDFESFDVAKEMDERAGVVDEKAEEMWANFGVRKSAVGKLEELMSSKAFSSLPQPMEMLRREPIEIKRAKK